MLRRRHWKGSGSDANINHFSLSRDEERPEPATSRILSRERSEQEDDPVEPEVEVAGPANGRGRGGTYCGRPYCGRARARAGSACALASSYQPEGPDPFTGLHIRYPAHQIFTL